MEMKNFLKEWKPGKMSKDERLDTLSYHLDGIADFYVKKSHANKELLGQWFKAMSDLKTAKTMKKVIKEANDNVNIGLVPMIYAFIEAYHPSVKSDEEEKVEVLNIYNDILTTLLEKRIKKMVKKTDLSEEYARELLVIVPSKDFVTNPNYMGMYTGRLCRKMYNLTAGDKYLVGEEEDKNPETMAKIFSFLFEEDLQSAVAVSILLEYKENAKNLKAKQKTIWSTLTQFALAVIETFKKKVIKELVAFYVERRKVDQKKGKDQARRLSLTQGLEESESPKLCAVIAEMKDDKKYKDFLF